MTDWVQSLFNDEPEEYGPQEKPKAHPRTARGVESVPRSGKSAERGGNWAGLPELHETAGAPPLDWWNVSEEEVHRRLILAMCPERVCRTCGEPSRRIVETTNTMTGMAPRYEEKTRRAFTADTNAWLKATGDTSSHRVTIGWTDCGHDDWRPGVVLDPFA